MDDEELIHFIRIIDKEDLLASVGVEERYFFDNLLSINIESKRAEIYTYIKKHPYLLTAPLGMRSVFDYFYEKTKLKQFENSEFEILVNMLSHIPGGERIKDKKYYILDLHKDENSYNELFTILFNNDFEIGDPEVLIYSIIARGELTKVKCISYSYVIEDYISIFDIAVRYGRHNIIKFLLEEININLETFGKVLDFENYVENSHFIYSTDVDVSNHDVPILESEQDYTKTIEYVLAQYYYPVTARTIDIWCNLIKSKLYIWDEIPTSVLLLLKSKLSTPLTLAQDFGEFNNIIFGQTATDINILIEYNLALQDKLYELQSKYDIVLDLYHRAMQANSIGNRRRSVTD